MSVNSTHIRYPFAPISDREGAFFFVTDYGCSYTIEVSKSLNRFGTNELLNNNGEVYEISFDGSCDDPKVKDDVVSNTIIHIIGSNIASGGDTAVYFFVCDNLDGKGRARSRLFDIWYYELVKVLTYLQKYNFVLPGYDDEEYHVSLFINSNHPFNADYTRKFEDNLNENFTKG